MKEEVFIQISKTELENLIESKIKAQLEELVFPKLGGKDTLLSRKEAANYLKVSLPTLDKWTKYGLIPVKKFGSTKRYSINELKKTIMDEKIGKFKRN